MKILELQSIDRSNRSELKWEVWSRAYEYPLILDLLEKYGATSSSNTHNSCWGSGGCHLLFKNILDKKFPNNINSDIRISSEPNTYIYDVKTIPKEEWVESFDFVINVSALEEIKGDHIDIFNKSFSMVKKGGYFLCTFDLPGLQLDKFEIFFNKIYKTTNNPISGINSVLPWPARGHLSCGYMVVQK
tara:strand:+ start:181 stop:744 length:564 start_codon:yes stop_codon:yes gene_type:complete